MILILDWYSIYKVVLLMIVKSKIFPVRVPDFKKESKIFGIYS